MKFVSTIAMISAINMVPVAVQAAPMTVSAPMTVVAQVKPVIKAPTIKVTVSYGTVKCTPNHTCGEHIRPW